MKRHIPSYLGLLLVALIITVMGCAPSIKTREAKSINQKDALKTAYQKQKYASEEKLKLTGVVDEELTTLQPSITLAFIADEMEHPPFTKMVEGEVTTMLKNVGRFQLVERDPKMIDKILHEQRYQNLGMTDKAVELGRFLGANYVVFVKIHSVKAGESLLGKLAAVSGKDGHKFRHIGYSMMMDLHLLDVNTMKEIHSVSHKVEGGVLMSEEVDAPYLEQYRAGVVGACNRMIKEIRRHFPLKGHIVEIIGKNQVGINLGAKHGVSRKQKLKVFRKTSTLAPIKEIGEIEVTTVVEEFAGAKVKKLEGKESIQVGDLVISAD